MFFWTLFIKIPGKNVSWFPQNYEAVFKTDNNKEMFTERHISKLERFLKNHVTLKTGVMMLKIQLWNHMNKLHFRMYKIKVIWNCSNYFAMFLFLLYFLLNKCSLDEQKTPLYKIKKNIKEVMNCLFFLYCSLRSTYVIKIFTSKT